MRFSRSLLSFAVLAALAAALAGCDKCGDYWIGPTKPLICKEAPAPH